MRFAGLGRLLVCGAVLAAAGNVWAGSLDILGHLSPGGPTEAVAISADGKVVVGSSNTASGKQQAFRWTVETGMVGLPQPEGLSMTWATDVSADGSYVVGYGGNSFSTREGWEAFRWNTSGSLDRIALSGQGVWGSGISAGGSIVVGTAQGVLKDDREEAYRWMPTGGMVPLSHTLYPGLVRTSAAGISANGQVVVGVVIDVNDPEHGIRDAFRWTPSDGMLGLGVFTATAASRDGSVIVGTIDTPQGREAYRWTLADGPVPLGTFAPEYESFALGVSGDGSLVVGYLESRETEQKRAFMWRADRGMRLVQDELQERYGFDLPGWTLTKAYAISDDGTTIVGRGYSPQLNDEAWRAVFTPEPSSIALLAVGGLCGLGYAWRRRRAKN